MTTARCPICGSARTLALPDPASRSMRSDGLVQPCKLSKRSCLACGTAFRLPRRMFRTAQSGESYTLNAKPDNSFDRRRHEGYANAVMQACVDPPASVVDVGCGNGALLELLRERWKDSRFCGVEPARLPREHAASRGFATRESPGPGLQADLVVSVNVIEHTPEPGAFLRLLSGLLPAGGRCVLIWPDDRAPSSELLLNDHLFTLSSTSVAALARANRLDAVRPLSVAQGFQGLLLRRRHAAAGRPVKPRAVHRAAVALAHDRSGYMRRWATLDRELLPRVDARKRLVAFGGGEAAQLLRAYASGLWSRVDALTADVQACGFELELPFLKVDELRASDHQLLLATHPRSHGPLRERFESAGFDCIAWNHLIQG